MWNSEIHRTTHPNHTHATTTNYTYGKEPTEAVHYQKAQTQSWVRTTYVYTLRTAYVCMRPSSLSLSRFFIPDRIHTAVAVIPQTFRGGRRCNMFGGPNNIAHVLRRKGYDTTAEYDRFFHPRSIRKSKDNLRPNLFVDHPPSLSHSSPRC